MGKLYLLHNMDKLCIICQGFLGGNMINLITRIDSVEILWRKFGDRCSVKTEKEIFDYLYDLSIPKLSHSGARLRSQLLHPKFGSQKSAFL